MGVIKLKLDPNATGQVGGVNPEVNPESHENDPKKPKYHKTYIAGNKLNSAFRPNMEIKSVLFEEGENPGHWPYSI